MFGHQLRLGRLQRAVTPPSLLLDFLSGAPLPPLTVSRATGGGIINAAGQYEWVPANTPRIDYDPLTLAVRGLLIEEQRTNLVPNSSGAGAVVGGALPSGWSVSAPGVSVSVVGVGTDLGVAYVDLRVQGTTTATYFALTSVSVSASTGKSYTASACVARVGGSASGISFGFVRVQGAYPGGTEQTDSPFSLSASWDLSRRYAAVRTMSSAGITSVRHRIELGWSSGVSVDITLRVACAQLEEGIFGTSYIPTSGAQATRAADSVTCAVGAWYSSAAGSLLADWLPQQYSTIPAPAVFTIAAGGNNGLSANGSARWWNGASSLATANSSPIGTIRRDAASWDASGRSVCLLGGAVASDGAAGINGTPTALRIGSASPSSQYVNGHIRRVAYWPRRMSAAELQGVTQ
jgi:hypothetical protein